MTEYVVPNLNTGVTSLSGIALNPGDSMFVDTGGSASGTVNDGGIEAVMGGVESNDTVNANGSEGIDSGGTVTNVTVNMLGTIGASNDGSGPLAIINNLTLNPGLEIFSSGTLNVGGLAQFYVGGELNNAVVNGGILALAANAIVNGTVTFGSGLVSLDLEPVENTSGALVGTTYGATFYNISSSVTIEIPNATYDGEAPVLNPTTHLLTIVESGITFQLQLDPSQNFSGETFQAALYGSASTVVTLNGPPVIVPPTIAGAVAGQTDTDQRFIQPFLPVRITDANSTQNVTQTETLTVTLSNPANGTLSNIVAGNYNSLTGVFTVVGDSPTVTSALNDLIFQPTLHQVSTGQTVTTTFTIQDTDTAGGTATDSTTTVVVSGSGTPSQSVNNPNGTSFLFVYNPSSTVSETITNYGGPNDTGTTLSETVNNTDGTSLLYAYNLSATVTETVTDYSGANDTGAAISTIVDNANGTSSLYAYNPTATVTETVAAYAGTNATGAAITDIVDNANGTSLLYAYNPTSTVTETISTYAGTNATGAEVSDIVDNTNGTSLLYAYNPTSTVTETAAAFAGSNASGTPISIVVDNTNGTSILYAYNPASGVTLTVSYDSGTNATGTLTSEIFDYANGQSAVTTYVNGVGTTVDFSGPNGTGSVIGGISGQMSFTTSAGMSVSAQTVSSTDASAIAIAGSNQFVDPGLGSRTIQFAAGATNDALLVHLGATDQVLGFDPSAGDTIDLASLLSEAGLNIADVGSQLANYVHVANTDGAAAILFDPAGLSGGSPVAVLAGDGGLAPGWQTAALFKV